MNKTEDFLKLEPLDKKLKSFNFEVKINGNNINQVIQALKNTKKNSNKPKFIIAETKKGKGINFMEKNIKWHHAIPNLQEFNEGMKYLKMKNKLDILFCFFHLMKKMQKDKNIILLTADQGAR